MLFAGWAAIFGWAVQFVDVMASVYVGYDASFIGGVIGTLWGFVDGAIAGVLIAFINNVVAKD